MPTVAIRSTALTSTHVRWLQPEPLWSSSTSEMTRPFVAEFDKDSFLPDFLTMMASSTITLHKPHDVQTQKDTNGSTLEVMKLYQPLHQRYYLVMGSLVCRQFGLPDHRVVAKNGEKTSFVLRRFINGIECGWVNDGPNKGWQTLVDARSRAVLIRKDEQRLPLHPVKICASTLKNGATDGNRQNTCNQRKVYYGYIPVDGREKYLSAATNVVQDIQQAVDNGTLTSDPRLDAFKFLVLLPWYSLYVDSNNNLRKNHPAPSSFQVPSIEEMQVTSLKLIVDLGNFLKDNLLSVFNAIVEKNDLLTDTEHDARQKLMQELKQIILDPSNPTMTMAKAITELQDSTKLADAEADPPTYTYNVYDAVREYPVADLPPGTYIDPFVQDKDANNHVIRDHQDAPTLPPPEKVYSVHVRDTWQSNDKGSKEVKDVKAYYLDSGGPGSLYTIVKAALKEEKDEKEANNLPWLTMPEEVTDMIKSDPVDGDVYFLRLVYEYGDGCVVVSDPSQPFTFAKPFDPDAPARHVRIELPSIKLSDLRKFKRGVGMQSSSELHQLTNNLSLDALNNGNISLPNAGSLGMICSFSIQIITLVAFIVMFIFLIALNIIFWWLPFVKICFPVPKPNKV